MGTILNRRRVMGGKSLPYDYEVDWLESTGTQYIDTGISLSTSTKYVLRGAKIGKRTSNKSGFFGSNNWLYSLIFYSGENNLRWCNTESYYDYNNIVSGIFYDIECNKEGAMYVDGDSTTYGSDSNEGNGNIRLFVGALYSASSVRIANFKMYNNDTLLRDFIPVVKDNVGYMYDKVSGQLFGNAGTGDFIFEEHYVEYLESTGTQYFNLGQISGQYIKIETKFQKTNDSTSEMAIASGARQVMELYTSDNNQIGIWNGNAGSAVFYGSIMSDVDYEVVAEINANGQSISVNGNSTARTGNINSVANNYIYLFAYNALYIFTGRIFYCKIWSNDILWRDLVPIRSGQKGYMIDKISGQIFDNDGSGSFIVGSDI